MYMVFPCVQVVSDREIESVHKYGYPYCTRQVLQAL